MVVNAGFCTSFLQDFLYALQCHATYYIYYSLFVTSLWIKYTRSRTNSYTHVYKHGPNRTNVFCKSLVSIVLRLGCGLYSVPWRQVKEHEKKNVLGVLTIPLSRLFNVSNMTLEQPFLLERSGATSQIKLKATLRVGLIPTDITLSPTEGEIVAHHVTELVLVCLWINCLYYLCFWCKTHISLLKWIHVNYLS